MRKQDTIQEYYSGVFSYVTSFRVNIGRAFFCGSLIDELEKKVKEKENKCQELIDKQYEKSSKFQSEIDSLKQEYEKLQEKGKAQQMEAINSSNKEITTLTEELQSTQNQLDEIK